MPRKKTQPFDFKRVLNDPQPLAKLSPNNKFISLQHKLIKYHKLNFKNQITCSPTRLHKLPFGDLPNRWTVEVSQVNIQTSIIKTWKPIPIVHH